MAFQYIKTANSIPFQACDSGRNKLLADQTGYYGLCLSCEEA